MTYPGTFFRRGYLIRGAALAALAGFLAGCAPVDDVTGSRLAQPPPGSTPRTPVDANDIAIVGQEVAHAILDIPAVANAAVPPMVQFNGVTSIVGPMPIDTDPYTTLFRDRLLLLTRLKLRFMEKTLPPLVIAPKKGKKKAATPPPTTPDQTAPDYQILAEIRGHTKDPFYRVQVQFIDLHTNEILFDGLYKIKKEGEPDLNTDAAPDDAQPPVDPNAPPPVDPTMPVPPDPNAPQAPPPTTSSPGQGTIY